MPISTIAIAISTLFGDGLAAFFSLNLGQGNSEKAARGVGTAVIASGVVSVLYTVLAFVSNNLLTQYGALSPYGPDIPLTTFSLCMKVSMIAFSVGIGVASGSQPIIGFNYGARKFDRVKKTFLLPAGLLDQMVEVCGDALAGRTDDQPFQFRDLKACITKACDSQFLRKDGKAAI